MHHDGALIADGGKKMVNDFATMLPYSPTFFPSDHQNPTTKAAVSFSNPICKPNFTTTDDLSILMVQHQDLLSRHKNCLSHLQTTFKEIETLRQENTNLRAANCDLNNRLNLIMRAYLQNNYASLISSGSGSSIPCPDHLDSADPISTNIEKFSGLHIDEGNSGAARCEGCESPASSLGNDLAEKDADRVSLPKSISVRSNGFLKVGQVSATPAGITSLPPNRVAKRTRSLVPVNAPVPQKVHVWGKNKQGEAIEVEVYSQGTSKTELCNKWQESGKCPYGENCEFAHGIEELRPVLRHPRYKTEVCRMVLSRDGCPYGHRCHFRHALTEQQNLNPPPLNLD